MVGSRLNFTHKSTDKKKPYVRQIWKLLPTSNPEKEKKVKEKTQKEEKGKRKKEKGKRKKEKGKKKKKKEAREDQRGERVSSLISPFPTQRGKVQIRLIATV